TVSGRAIVPLGPRSGEVPVCRLAPRKDRVSTSFHRTTHGRKVFRRSRKETRPHHGVLRPLTRFLAMSSHLAGVLRDGLSELLDERFPHITNRTIRPGIESYLDRITSAFRISTAEL